MGTRFPPPFVQVFYCSLLLYFTLPSVLDEKALVSSPYAFPFDVCRMHVSVVDGASRIWSTAFKRRFPSLYASALSAREAIPIVPEVQLSFPSFKRIELPGSPFHVVLVSGEQMFLGSQERDHQYFIKKPSTLLAIKL